MIEEWKFGEERILGFRGVGSCKKAPAELCQEHGESQDAICARKRKGAC